MEQADRDAVEAWEKLRRDHPALARELSREVFVARAGESLRRSEAYRSAVQSDDRVRAAEVVAGVIHAVISRLLL